MTNNDIIITNNHEITLYEEDNHMTETTTATTTTATREAFDIYATPACFEGVAPVLIGNGTSSDPLTSYEIVTAMTGEVEGRLEAFKSDFSHDLFRLAELEDSTSSRGAVAWWMVRKLGTYFMHNPNPAGNIEELEDLRTRYEERAVYRITKVHGGYLLERFEDTFKPATEPEPVSVLICQYGDRYLVKRPKGCEPWVVCSNWRPEAPEGEKWDLGHYFYNQAKALRYLLGIGDISPARLEEIATKALEFIVENEDEGDRWECIKDALEDLDLDDDELEFFGFEKPKRYKVLEVEFTRTSTTSLKVVVPEDFDEDCDDVWDFVDSDDIADNFDSFTDDWGVSPSVIADKLTREEVGNYSTTNDVYYLD